MTLEEIYKLDPKERITELKRRKTTLPDAGALLKDWDEKQHVVFDPNLRPKRRFLTEDEVKDANGKVTKQARYELKDVNRIALPLEQDVVNIHTAFTVGIEPKLTLVGKEEKEQSLFDILKSIYRQNKIKFINKKAVRSWLSEKEVAEYWYTVEDSNWWKRILNKVLKLVGSSIPDRKLKVALWSPFLGDKLYPYFDEYGDLIVLSREYKTADVDGQNEAIMLMSIDKSKVTIYKNGEYVKEFVHGFKKLPVIYMYRENAYCEKVRSIRERLETLLSNFADCLDFNFFPKLAAVGVVEGIMGRNSGSEIIQLENGASISYLTWQQSPDMAKLEFDNLTERFYALTNTPRTTVDALAGNGTAVAGVAFRYTFMGAHMAVSNHAEVVEDYLQRRVNFIIHAIGAIYPAYKDTSESTEIETEVVPFIIDNKSDNIDMAVAAVGGGVASRKQGIILAGITDAIEEENALIAIEQKQNTINQKVTIPISK